MSNNNLVSILDDEAKHLSIYCGECLGDGSIFPSGMEARMCPSCDGTGLARKDEVGKLASRLYETRMEMGLSLRGLADMVKVSYGTLNHIEKRKVLPRPQTVVKLNNVLWPDSPIDVTAIAKEYQELMSNRGRKEVVDVNKK